MNPDLSLFNYVADGICILNLEYKVIFWNMSLERMVGVSADEITGKSIFDFYPALKSPSFIYRLNQVMKEGSPVIFSNQLHGNLFPSVNRAAEIVQHIVVTPLPSGENIFYGVINIKDISELSRKIDEYKKARKRAIEEVERRKESEKSLKASLREKEFLIREVHHRVKNNLALVGNIIKLQQMHFPKDDRTNELLNDLFSRINSISRIHERLYKGAQLDKIEMRDYLRAITTDILEAMNSTEKSIKVSYNIDNISLNPDTAIPIGLITTEVVTNSIKYAFKDSLGGKISVLFTHYRKDSLLLKISDNGAGFQEGFDPEISNSMGFKVIKALTEQLGGVHTVSGIVGVEHKLIFKKRGK